MIWMSFVFVFFVIVYVYFFASKQSKSSKWICFVIPDELQRLIIYQIVHCVFVKRIGLKVLFFNFQSHQLLNSELLNIHSAHTHTHAYVHSTIFKRINNKQSDSANSNYLAFRNLFEVVELLKWSLKLTKEKMKQKESIQMNLVVHEIMNFSIKYF